MQKSIQHYVLMNWEQLFSARTRPNGLVTLQVSQSHGKEYDFGRIVHMLFEEGASQPVIVARFCRDASYEVSMENETKLLSGLEKTGIGANVPKVLGTARIDGRLVMFEEAVAGKPVSVLARDAYYIMGKEDFKKLVTGHMKMAAAFLMSLRAETACVAVGPAQSYTEPVFSSYSGRQKLEVLEEYIITGTFRAADRLLETKPECALIHTDFTPSNIFLSVDGGIKVIDWEFASPGRLGFLDTMRFIYYYYTLLVSLGELGGDAFHDTFIKRSNWFSEAALEFAIEVEKGIINDAHDFRTLLACFLVFEANLQMDVAGPIGADVTKFHKELINNLTGFSSFKERTILVEERDGLVEERDSLVRERDGLVRERDGLVREKESLVGEKEDLLRTISSMENSKSWRLTYPLRFVSGLLKNIKPQS